MRTDYILGRVFLDSLSDSGADAPRFTILTDVGQLGPLPKVLRAKQGQRLFLHTSIKHGEQRVLQIGIE